jgi:hypothetical protein
VNIKNFKKEYEKKFKNVNKMHGICIYNNFFLFIIVTTLGNKLMFKNKNVGLCSGLGLKPNS